MACNRKEIVDAVLERLRGVDNFDKAVQLQVMKEKLTPTGKIFFFLAQLSKEVLQISILILLTPFLILGAVKTWERHERIQALSVREIFTRFLDITTPPSTKVLKYLATVCSDQNEADYLRELIEV